MFRARRLTTRTALALALWALRPGVADAKDPPSVRGSDLARAEALESQALALDLAGKYVEATAVARAALALREKSLGPEHPLVAQILNHLANTLHSLGSHEEAKALYERALAIREKALGKDDPFVAEVLTNLGRLRATQGAYEDAKGLLDRALEIEEKAFGEDDARVADVLAHQALLSCDQGFYADGRRLGERALAIREKALGKDSIEVGLSANDLGVFLAALGEHREARLQYDRALAIFEKALGKDHPFVARTLHNIAIHLQWEGKYSEVRPLLDRALAIQEKALGKDHPLVAGTLESIATFVFDLGAFAQARPLCERALAIREKALGKDHPDVAVSLDMLGGIVETLGAYREARPLFVRALAIREKSLGRDHPFVVRSLDSLAGLSEKQGDFTEARALLDRALSTAEKSLGTEHFRVAQSLNSLALFLLGQGAYAEARPLLERALAIRERGLGKDHPDVAASCANLAQLAIAQGNYAEARPLLERALAISEKAVGRDHPDVAASLNTLASLFQGQGNYAEARPLLERALSIQERSFGKDHPFVANTLASLAQLLGMQGSHSQAKPLLERALAIQEKALGKDHPEVARSLATLAEILRAQGTYPEAQALGERALAIHEKALGKDHPALAADLNNLACVFYAQGAYAKARPLFERAIAIDEKALGKDHSELATNLANLASVLDLTQAYGEARPIYARVLAMTEAHARAQLSALSARQRLGLLRSTRYRLDDWLRFAPKVGLSGYPEVLRFRGLVARAETAERILSRRARGDDQRALEELKVAQRRAARLANENLPSFKPEVRAAWQKAYADACAEREQRTLELAGRTAPLRIALERLDLGLHDVQAQLAPDAALVDFLRVGDRYLAWIVRATGEPRRLDVGDADAIEKASADFIASILEDDPASASGAALRALVWAPVEATLGAEVRRVVICPDAALAALPFAALPGRAPGTVLLDDLTVSFVMNAQDLVPWKDAPPSGSGALLVGGVDYELAASGTRERPLPERPPALAALDRAPRGGAFVPIPQTKVEVQRLGDRFGKNRATLLLGADATEARLRVAVKGRRFVHIATHGFVREDLLAGLYSRKIQDSFTSADAERQLSVGHDPMLLAGLAMAGANPRDGAGGDDGVLTALEASYLDLDGVELVTLSACETAKGTAESGDGVQGLVSAVQMAGARGVVASLWKVDDEGTRRLMEGLYERMLRRDDPLAPADALREASRALRDFKDPTGKARFAAPRYWAAFVAYGR